MSVPTISQYLLSTCLFTIDELNEQYNRLSKEDLKKVADEEFNEMDITVRLGPTCNCIFLGNENDVFHFAIFY